MTNLQRFWLRRFTMCDPIWFLLAMVIGLLISVSLAQQTSPPSKPKAIVTKPSVPATTSGESSLSTDDDADENLAGWGDPLPPGSTSVLATAKLPPAELIPCANEQPHDRWGKCPRMPACAKRCYVGLAADQNKGCGFKTDPAPSKYQMYSAQRINGKVCAWTFPPADNTP